MPSKNAVYIHGKKILKYELFLLFSIEFPLFIELLMKEKMGMENSIETGMPVYKWSSKPLTIFFLTAWSFAKEEEFSKGSQRKRAY